MTREKLREVSFLRAVEPRHQSPRYGYRTRNPVQLTLFPRDEENLIATLVIEIAPVDMFVRAMQYVRPWAVFDLRVSPRFGHSGLNRRLAFEIIKDAGSLYFDLSGEAGALRRLDSRLNPAFLGERVRERISQLEGTRSIMFFIDQKNDSPEYMDTLLTGMLPDEDHWNWMRIGIANQSNYF